MKGRDEEALKALNKLRRKSDVENGNTVREMEAIKAEIECLSHMDQGRWVDLFVKKYRKRTIMVVALFFFYQVSRIQHPANGQDGNCHSLANDRRPQVDNSRAFDFLYLLQQKRPLVE